MNFGRGSGRTTRQLLALPQGGWYFYYGSDLYYKNLCRELNRTDIILKPYTDLRYPHKFHGWEITGFDIDHAVNSRKETWPILEAIDILQSRVKS